MSLRAALTVIAVAAGGAAVSCFLAAKYITYLLKDKEG